MPDRSVVVITGASAGVGRATAKAFAENGFNVALLARGQAGLEAASKDVTDAGARALTIPTDVSQFVEVDAAATKVEEQLGPIDVWVNNAMTTVFAPSWDAKPTDFQRAVEVTFLGQVWGTQAALARMRPRARGNTVNVGSALAFVGIPLQGAYCSSKFACRGFFESTRAELLHEGSHVHLTMVHLPAVNTPQFGWCETTLDRHPQPVAPIYQPEVPAKYILQAALDGRRSKTLGSWNKMLVFTDTLFPGFGNQYAALAAWDGQLTDQPLQNVRLQSRRLHGSELPAHTSQHRRCVRAGAGADGRREAAADGDQMEGPCCENSVVMIYQHQLHLRRQAHLRSSNRTGIPTADG